MPTPNKKRPSAKKLKFWQALKPGDLVDVIAPASGSSPEDLEKGLKNLQALGLEARVSKSIFGPDLFCANDDLHRFKDLKRALLDERSKAVWCFRGGYGATRLLPEIAQLKRPKTPKLLIGYSDITALHQFINQQWHWPSLHASVVEELGKDRLSPGDLSELKAVLFGEIRELEFKGLRPLNRAAEKKAVLSAELVGGNLTVLTALLATPWQIAPRGQILFLEDTDERGYRVDRMLTQLAQAGYFKKVKAIIFGEFNGGLEKDGRALWPEAQKAFAAAVNFPVLKGLPCGHNGSQRPLPLLTRAFLELKGPGVAELRVQTGRC